MFRFGCFEIIAMKTATPNSKSAGRARHCPGRSRRKSTSVVRTSILAYVLAVHGEGDGAGYSVTAALFPEG